MESRDNEMNDVTAEKSLPAAKVKADDNTSVITDGKKKDITEKNGKSRIGEKMVRKEEITDQVIESVNRARVLDGLPPIKKTKVEWQADVEIDVSFVATEEDTDVELEVVDNYEELDEIYFAAVNHKQGKATIIESKLDNHERALFDEARDKAVLP